jgi:hypothetical protein
VLTASIIRAIALIMDNKPEDSHLEKYGLHHYESVYIFQEFLFMYYAQELKTATGI